MHEPFSRAILYFCLHGFPSRISNLACYSENSSSNYCQMSWTCLSLLQLPCVSLNVIFSFFKQISKLPKIVSTVRLNQQCCLKSIRLKVKTVKTTTWTLGNRKMPKLIKPTRSYSVACRTVVTWERFWLIFYIFFTPL